jgi:ribosomal protein S27AE
MNPPAPPVQTDATARAKFNCPACGAEATWNPTKKALICGYCGTTSPAELSPDAAGSGAIVEHDLAVALRSVPDSARGWQATKTSVRCQSCHAISVFDATKVGQRCDFCGSSALVPYEEVKEAFRPESLLPLKISEAEVRDSIRQWYGSRWFAPNKLGTKALTDTVHGAYLPYWTFDAQVRAAWTAESGYYYYTTESYTDANGNRQTRQVRQVRWERSQGSLEHFFDDELIPASKGVHPGLLRKVEPFPTKDLVPYNAGFLAGWVVERYQIDLVSAAQSAREGMSQQVEAMCARQVPGDTYRNLQVRADWSGQTFKHILAPVWLLTYDYHGKSYQVVVNGFTGRIAGEHPLSFWKIFFLVVGILILVGLFLLVSSRR